MAKKKVIAKGIFDKRLPWGKSITLLLISTAVVGLGIVWYGSKYTPTSQSLDIFVIGTPIAFGEIELAGTIRKDSQRGKPGYYFLVMSDDRLVLVEPTSKMINDTHMGKQVAIQGNLEPLEHNDDVVGVLVPKTVKLQ